MTVFVDTSVVMYAGGADHPHRPACRTVMAQVADGRLDAVTSVEVVQEMLHRFARGRREIGSRMARSVIDVFGDVLAVDRRAIIEAVARYEQHPQLSASDALHVATCVVNGIDDIVSVDTGFDIVSDVRRIGPDALVA